MTITVRDKETVQNYQADGVVILLLDQQENEANHIGTLVQGVMSPLGLAALIKSLNTKVTDQLINDLKDMVISSAGVTLVKEELLGLINAADICETGGDFDGNS